MNLRVLSLPWTTIVVASETEIFIPCTAFIDANGVVIVRPTIEIAAEFGNMELSAAYQTANVENNPDTAVAFGGYRDAIDTFYPADQYDIGTATKSKQLVRFGFLARNKSGQGTSPSMMRVGGKVEIS